MPDILSARMESARSHYPSNYQTTQAIPYRQIISTNSQVYRRIIESQKSKVKSQEMHLLVFLLLAIQSYLLLATCYFKDWLFPTYYHYQIKAKFKRLHCNPPIWHDYHCHDFEVTLVVKSPCYAGDIYGVDMIEAEQTLQQLINGIPEKINDLRDCSLGTTEQLCNYFLKKIQFCDRSIKIVSISVSETPNRVTKLWKKPWLF